jgi:hypothetical protein
MTDAAAPLLDHQLAYLDRLAEHGLDMTGALAAQAKGTGPVVVEGDIALAYSRVSRAVRMAVMLQSKLLADAEARKTAAIEAEEAETRDDKIRFSLEQGRKARVERIVGRIYRAHDEDADEDRLEEVRLEAGERLDDDDLYGDVLTRPISDLVAQVCEDLGLAPDWPALSQEPWAQREVRSGEVGKVLALYASSPASGGGGPEGRRGHAAPPPEPPS